MDKSIVLEPRCVIVALNVLHIFSGDFWHGTLYFWHNAEFCPSLISWTDRYTTTDMISSEMCDNHWMFYYRFDLLLPRTALKSSSISTALHTNIPINIILFEHYNASFYLYRRTTSSNVYRVGQKKWTPNALHITSSNIGRFKKFFHCYNLQKIWNAVVINYSTTPQKRRYTTLWNVYVRILACSVRCGACILCMWLIHRNMYSMKTIEYLMLKQKKMTFT